MCCSDMVSVPKLVLIFFNLTVFVAGATSIISGFYFMNNDDTKELPVYDKEGKEILWSVVELSGTIVCVFAFIGFYGTISESRLLLLLYFWLLFILIIAEFTVLGMGFYYKNKLGDIITTTFENYNRTSESRMAVNMVQSQFECCGTVNNTTPWNETNPTPESCKSYKDNYNLYKDGCIPVLTELVNREFKTFCCIIGAFEFVEIVILMFTGSRISRVHAKRKYIPFK